MSLIVPLAPSTQMRAPLPFRILVLADESDVAMRRAAGALIDQLGPDWFAPELWPLGQRGGAELIRLVRRLRSEPPALVYSLLSGRRDWSAVIAALSGIPVVADTRHRAGIGAGSRMFRRCYRRIIADRVAIQAEPAGGLATDQIVELPSGENPSAFDAIGNVLREVLQLGSSWTTTSKGDLPLELRLWAPEPQPEPSDRVEERGRGRPNRSIRFTAGPSITVFTPDEGTSTGAAVVICPGGGYAGVTIDKEGYDVARWFAARGVAGIVLKYRLPRADLTGEALPFPMADLDQALSLTRQHASSWGIDPRRIGVMGFSAGGHMAAWASRAAIPPAFAVLVYPVISMDWRLTHAGSRKALLGRSATAAMVERYSLEHGLSSQVPPTFVVHAEDDTVAKFGNSKVYLEALHRAKISAESLICARGGHGFGVGINGGEIAAWPDRCFAWMRRLGVV